MVCFIGVNVFCLHLGGLDGWNKTKIKFLNFPRKVASYFCTPIARATPPLEKTQDKSIAILKSIVYMGEIVSKLWKVIPGNHQSKIKQSIVNNMTTFGKVV